MSFQIKTSITHPLRIDSVIPMNASGTIGMTFAPGKRQKGAISGGEWDRDLGMDIEAMVAWGATVLLSLVEDHELQELQISGLEEALIGKLVLYRLPIVDGDVPDQKGEKMWDLIGPELHRRLVLGERIVIHCKGGLGRTGVMAARLLIECGEDPVSAVKRVRSSRPGAIENALQENYLYKLLHKAD